MTFLHIPGRKADRYDLRSWSDGYEILDRGTVVVTIHGPQWDLATRVLHSLRAEDLAARSMERA